jgi:hypothetical protein
VAVPCTNQVGVGDRPLLCNDLTEPHPNQRLDWRLATPPRSHFRRAPGPLAVLLRVFSFRPAGIFGGVSTATLVDTPIIGNDAIGGAGGAGAAGGLGGEGGIAQGAGLNFNASTVELTGVPFIGNQAIGGAGGAGTAGGSGGAGGLSQGGGLYSGGAFVSNDIAFVPTPEFTTATSVTFAGNLAQGGAGGQGSGTGAAGTGGNGAGCGIYNDGFSTLDLASGLLSLNAARGGTGGRGGSGGDGLGGAIYNAGPTSEPPGLLPGATLAIVDTLILGNLAEGGDAGDVDPDGSSGQGIGGGLYLASGGTATLKKTVVTGNRASTSNDNIYGSYTTA